MRQGNHNPRRVEIEPIAAAQTPGSVALPRVPRRKPSEDGYTLLAVIFLLAILTLWMSVAVPKMTRSIQRDHEVEAMHRGKQYIRAVQLYYRKFHAYPPSMDAMVKTNEIRFLRKKYIDPITGKDDWKPIMFGQNKEPIVFGFFGQPLATGSTLAGIGASGGNGIQGLGGTPGSGLSGGSQNGASGTFGSIFNSQQGTSTTSTPSTDTGSTGTTDSSGGTTGTDANSGSGTSGTDSSGSSTPGSGIGGSGIGGSGIGGSGIGGSGIGGTTGGIGGNAISSGQTFGGAGIIGVRPASPKVSLLIFKKKNHYNEWEFDYDPAMEMMMQQGGNTGMIGTSAAGMSNPIGSSGFGSTNNVFGGNQTGSTPFSSNNGSNDTNSGSGPSTTPPTPPTPTSPQQ
jgi:type II secretory pathway pseudopilin PulG